MSKDAPHEEGFLGRWSRLKADAREAQPEPPPPVAAHALSAEEAPPELPPVDTLTIDSDFRGFFHPKVDEDLRRTALRKLFSDPHFNVMDGLDTYIDDYSVSEPIPAEMLAGMKQAQRILRWAEGHDDEEGAKHAEEEDAAAPAADSPALDAAPGDNASDADALHVADLVADSMADPVPQAVAKPA